MYMVIEEEIGRNGDTNYSAAYQKDTALKELKELRDRHIESLGVDKPSAKDIEDMEWTNDWIDEPEYFYHVDEIRIQIVNLHALDTPPLGAFA